MVRRVGPFQQLRGGNGRFGLAERAVRAAEPQLGCVCRGERGGAVARGREGAAHVSHRLARPRRAVAAPLGRRLVGRHAPPQRQRRQRGERHRNGQNGREFVWRTYRYSGPSN